MSNENETKKNKGVVCCLEGFFFSIVVPFLFLYVIPYINRIQAEIVRRTFNSMKAFIIEVLGYLLLGLFLAWNSIYQRKMPNKYQKSNFICALLFCVFSFIFSWSIFYIDMPGVLYRFFSSMNFRICFLLIGFYFVLFLKAVLDGRK